MRHTAAGLELIRRPVRAVLPATLYASAAEASNAFWGILRVGWGNYAKLRALYPDRSESSETLTRFSLPQLHHPIYCRQGASDAREVVHSVIREAYATFLPSPPVRVIVDAGANIGDTTSWYLSRFPEATVVAIEPDLANYALLVRNCSPYGSRAVLLNAALWCSRTQVTVLHRKDWFAGHAVSDSVGLAEATSQCEAVTMDDVLDLVGGQDIDILKCDIEGAEERVFSGGCDSWLSKVRTILIEIHGDAASQMVLAATRRHAFNHRTYRDIHAFWL